MEPSDLSWQWPSPAPRGEAEPVPAGGWAGRRERWAWAMFDFANSGYTTVVLTTVFNAYFVAVVAGAMTKGRAVLLWTCAVALANLLVLLSAPVIGAIADAHGAKKRLLLASAVVCLGSTALLATTGAGTIGWAMILLVVSNVAFGIGEDLVAAFLPELAPPREQGRLSAFGWSVGYVGGLIVLALSLAIVTGAGRWGLTAHQAVPGILLLVAGTFGLAALPTALWLRERAPQRPLRLAWREVGAAAAEVRRTIRHARRYQDLFRFLLALAVYQCGVNTVVVVAAVYAQQVMGFDTAATITLILVVNVMAAVGAALCGRAQDRWGSVPTLAWTLIVWLLAAILAYAARSLAAFWLAANLVGLALGSSQSVGRALVAKFTPIQHAGEFLGLWGVGVKLAAVIGPLSYGLVNLVAGGNQRSAMLGTAFYFLAGLGLLSRVDEQRGRQAASVAEAPKREAA